MRKDLFRIQNGSCHQGNIAILEDISLELQMGEIQGAFFENRNEEDKFLQVLCGKAELTGGRVYYRDHYVPCGDARKFFGKEIFLLVFQGNWAPELTIADFFCLYDKKLGKYKNLLDRKIYTLSEAFDIEIIPEKKLYQLSDVEKIELELIRAFDRGFTAVILRGMTSALAGKDCNRVIRMINQLRQRGMIFLLLDHAEALANYCTAGIYAVSQGRTVFVYGKEELKEYLLANEIRGNPVVKDTQWNGEVLQIRGLELDEGIRVDLSVYEGEIVSVLDTKGIYANKLAAILRGEQEYHKGNIWFRGIPFAPVSTQEVVQSGIGIIEEREGDFGQELFYNLTALENLELLLAGKHLGWLIKRNHRRSIISESEGFWKEEELNTRVEDLTPWQRQRLAYYRWYLYFPPLMVCVKPLTSLDRQMRKEAEQMIHKYQERGMAVLIITTNVIVADTLGGKQVVL